MITMTETMQKTWKYLISAGLTPAGAAGMMGNLYAESGIIPNRVEILCLKRLKEAGKKAEGADEKTEEELKEKVAKLKNRAFSKKDKIVNAVIEKITGA